MAAEDWYRRGAWSDADAEDFAARLARSRSSFHKSQYLRIQASTLADTGKRKHAHAALELLDRVFEEFPDASQLSSAHLVAAQCHEQLGNLEEALAHFHRALDAQEAYPNHDTGVRLEYPWFVARHSVNEEYASALSTIEEAHLAFPVQAFKAAAARALIFHARGQANAAEFAAQALEAADSQQSKFRYHDTLGLVDKSYAPYIKRLRAITKA